MTILERREATDEAAPEAPPEGGGARHFEMIEPPTRGDRSAKWYLGIGAAFYIVFALLLVFSLLGARPDKAMAVRELFGLGEHLNLIIFILVAAGIGLTVFAGWTVWRDIVRLRGEEDDVEWVLQNRREGLMLVFLTPRERAVRLAARELTLREGEGRHVETLIDDRVRRVHQSQTDGGASHISADELRGIAETRTLRYGHVARFVSSLLLLLAVLGTFAGVKTALPSLIDAISAAGGAGQAGGAEPAGRVGKAAGAKAGAIQSDAGKPGGMQGDLVGPLRAVSDAFGGNSLALVGAIAVGLMAQGLSVGRRHLLERLELVSAEYIYDRRRTQSADPLIAAVDTLSGAAEAVRDASGSFLGLEGTLEGLAESFQRGFDALNDQLADLMRQQDEALHQRTSRSLDELQERVLAMSGTVAQNTMLYASLVDRVGERGAESREAMKEMQDASRTLGRAITSIEHLGAKSEQAAAELDNSLAALALGTTSVDERMAAVADSIERARPAMEQVEATVRAAAERVAGIDERAAQSWREVAEQVRRELEGIGQRAAPEVVSSGGGLSPDAVGLLRRIAASAEAPRGPAPLAIAGAVMGGVVGAAAVIVGVESLIMWLTGAL